MGQPIEVRTDFSAVEVRRLARRAEDSDQVRRLLAIAAVLDGASRAEAARLEMYGAICKLTDFQRNGFICQDASRLQFRLLPDDDLGADGHALVKVSNIAVDQTEAA